MRLTAHYKILVSAKALPYIKESDLRRDPDPGRREWEELGLPETFVHRGDRYSFTGRVDVIDGDHTFPYEAGQKTVWVGRDRTIRSGPGREFPTDRMKVGLFRIGGTGVWPSPGIIPGSP